MSFEVLYQPFEQLDAELTALFDGSAVTSLVTADDA